MGRTLGFGVLVLIATRVLLAQGTGPNDEELRKQAQNPIASLISVPFQNNTNFPVGRYSRVQNVLNVQPVIPVSLSEDWNLLMRWITPIVYQPDVLRGEGGANGLGDMNPSFFLSPSKPGKLIWGVGPSFLLPTATYTTLGQGKWGAGPSFVLLVQPEHWTIGMVTNNIWSFAGNKERTPVDQFYIQYFLNYNMKKGWYTGTAPIVTANWKAAGVDRWTVPFGWLVGRIVRVGDLPMNFQLGSYYNLIHPENLPYGKWQVRLEAVFLFPKAK
jgi:hypothetical protein